MAFSPAQIVQLKEFVKALKAAPELLHEDALSFFKDYLVSLGATIPEKKKREEKHEAPKPAEEPDDLPDLEPEFEPVPEEPEEEIVEPVDPSVIPAESDAPQQMGDLTAEVSDDNRDKAQELRGKATEHIAAGELNEAINVLTEAITKYNGSSAPLYASRGQCFLRLKKPASAIRDADTAIKINPDSAAPFKVRGRAKALLGQWSGAVADLKAANQRDYDPEINVVLKEISVKADEAAARQKKRDEQKQRREANNKPASGGSSGGAGAGFGGGGFGGAGFGGAGAGFGGAKKGGPGGMPNIPPELLATLMQDPDVLAALGDPEVMPILNKLMTDPASVAQYKDHPKLGKLISKFAGMFPAGQQ